MNTYKVSIIITTKNEEKNIENCLESIKKQTYKNVEIVVVDNSSIDKTKEIARKYTRLVFEKGPERSAQRNYGAKKATGEYVLFLDADMILSPNVIEDCVQLMAKSKVGGIIIPEESFGKGFWAQVKSLERSFYLGNAVIEAARFYDRKKFLTSGGFDEEITGPEDWDLSQKIKKTYGIMRISSFILHNEGNLSLSNTLKKKYYYAKKFSIYLKKETNRESAENQLSIINRYKIFLSKPHILFKNPVMGCGVLFLKTAEFAAGAFGYLAGRLGNK